MSAIKKILLSVFALFLILTCSDKKRASLVSVKNDLISIQFNNLPTFSDTLKLNKNQNIIVNSPYISYKTKINFLSKIIEFNKDENELKVNIRQDTIFLKLRYAFSEFETFIFCRGDSVQIDVANDRPKVNILNRVSKKYDYNLGKVIKVNRKPKNNISFLTGSGRFRNKIEQEQYRNSSNKYNEELIFLLDSLKSKDLLSSSIYEFKKKEAFYTIERDTETIEGLINDGTDLHIDAYTDILINYTKNKIHPKVLKTSNGYVSNSKGAFDFVLGSNLFNSQSKDFLLWSFLKNVAKDFPKKDFDNRFKTFSDVAKNKYLIDNIESEYLIGNPENNDKTNQVFVVKDNKQEINLEQILKENKGKVIFFDFWASWCAPCRKVMPDSKKLVKEYESEDIMFFFISIDKNFKDWQKASEKEGLQGYDNNLLAINYPSADFFKKLNLRSIPRYIIFNKKGELVEKNAPDPSSDNIRSVLNEYINE